MQVLPLTCAAQFPIVGSRPVEAELLGAIPRGSVVLFSYIVGFIGGQIILVGMNKKKAKEILNGGQTNDLRKTGSLIKDPTVVVQLLFDECEYDMAFGSFDLDESSLDFAVHRTKDVNLGEQEEYYSLNLVEADVYRLTDSDDVSVQRFEATPTGWIGTSQ